MAEQPKPPPTLWDMPELPMTTIIQYLGPAATVNFAQTYPHVENFIKTLNLNVESISVDIAVRRCEIRLVFFYSEKMLTWKFSVPNEEKEEEDNKTKKTYKKKKTTIIEKCQNPTALLRERVEWLTALVRFPVSNVHIVGPAYPASEALLDWTQIHQCENLHMDLISETTGSLVPFNDLERLELASCEFLRPGDLRELEIQDISIFSSNWTSEDLSHVIRDWVAGGNRKLETLTVNLKNNYEPGVVLAGLETKEWDREKRQKDYPREDPYVAIDCESARDIERADGLLASILIEHCFLTFVVWHKRFQDSEEEKMEE
ncbi:hypothetical protein CAEBREN_08944 [Caenorhabditis brenneri]|uniref:F-box associated domain-containing protein n=1 Tax=Caenorhabditis brenneri TaxID=135651 RepID=G0MC34_CAEBE|nr:hypothetical protein CAEBREN_08944 [Caenorhabditis brenneri]